MKVLKLIQEIDDMLTDAQAIPLSKKVGVDPNEIRDILNEIKDSLPDEIATAQHIMNERQRLMDKAKEDYNNIINKANERAEELISEDEITYKAKLRAEDLLRKTKENCTVMKLNLLTYTDDMLCSLSDKTDEVKAIYFEDMFNSLDEIFNQINASIVGSREGIKDQVLKVQQEQLDKK